MAVFTNQAFLNYNGTTLNSNIVTGEVVEVLSAQKNAVSGIYVPGDKITYVVSLVNAGATPITGVTVTDDLGAYTFGNQTLVPLTYVDNSVKYYADGVLQATPVVTATSPLTVSNLTVPANGDAILIYEAEVNGYAPQGAQSVINNSATVTAQALSVPVTAQETIAAQDGARLSITKSASPTTVNENGELTYILTVYNSGNTAVVAGENATVSDTFNPVLNNITVTYNGALWTEGVNYTYDSTTGQFVTLSGQLTIPAATYAQNPVTGEWETTPGTAVIQVTGIV